MLYLIKLDNAYKIGFSDDVKRRIKDLQATHLDTEIIALREGGIPEEKALHLACAEYHIKNELFKIDSFIIDIFKNYVFDSLFDEIKKLTVKVDKYEKEIEVLKGKLNHRDDFSSQVKESELKTIKEIERSTSLKGQLITYKITYYEDLIKIGDLIFYNKISNKILNPYGSDAKKYVTKTGVEMYYIATGLALNIIEIEDIINSEITL